jgi:ubiquinone biosynthesis protein UbiJ
MLLPARLLQAQLLPALICAVGEPLLNKIIRLDAQLQQRLQPLVGKQLAFEIAELNWRLVLTAQPNGIWLNQHQETVDCAVRTNIGSLSQLTDPAQLTRLIRADELQIDGDLATLQRFSHFFSALEPDWQEYLSGYLGDAPTHQITRMLQHLTRQLRQKLANYDATFTELSQDELQLTPAPAAVAEFSQQVSALSGRTEVLAQQIALLRREQ